MMTETVQDNHSKTSFQESGEDRQSLGATPEVGRLLGFICHDLRHPLTAILAYSEFLAEDDLDRSQRKDFHQEIRLAVDQMNDLISLLLVFSRDSGTFRSEWADIADTIERAIRVVAVRPEFRGIVIRYDHKGLSEGWFDPKGLQQVVMNVVLNACEAVPPESGRVQVTSIGRHDGLEIHVSDNGPGIPEPLRHTLLQPFVTYGKAGGTGLGLAIVQKILRSHGGEIYLETPPNGGTLIRLVLPCGSRRLAHRLP
jgi:signal transduction histidine kinase